MGLLRGPTERDRVDAGVPERADTAGAYQAGWNSQVLGLRLDALHTLGYLSAGIGYVAVVAQLLRMNPGFSWQPMVFPLGTLALGLLVARARSVWSAGLALVSCAFVLTSVALFVDHGAGAPFAYVAIVGAATLIAGPWAIAAAASLGSALVLLAGYTAPATWSSETITWALILGWIVAAVAWVTSHNLYLALSWALRGYEDAWRTMRELQEERGRLNATLKALAEANVLLKHTTYDLVEAREEAEHARQMKSQFAANISHELRTPLHLIVGFSQIMYSSPETYEGARWTPDLRADVHEIFESARHLLDLIDDVLDLSQIEVARLPISKERTSLADVITEATGTARALMRDRPVSLQVSVPAGLPLLYADPTRIRQVLLNLLNNAARFTEQGSITVSARELENEVEVEVRDTGIGIPCEQASHVFEEFYQVDGSLKRSYGGSGLGLAICKQFVQLHDGRIWVESNPGEGSAFHFTLPLPGKGRPPLQASSLPAGWRYPAGRPPRARTIVTTGEEPEFARLLARHLPEAEVLVSATTAQTARLAMQQLADAIILPAGATSLEERARLAAETEHHMLPVVTCSLALERHLALAEGFGYCLMKPFTAEQLLAVLQEAAPAARKLLVVDDDQGVVRLVERMLSLALPDLRVLPAYNGEEALARLAEQPDIILLDLVLPDTSGLTVLEELRRQSDGAATPVVAITAVGFRQEMAALEQGVVEIRRGKGLSAGETSRWLESFLEALPARHLSVDELTRGPGTAPVG